MAAKTTPQDVVVTFWNSALGHSVRDAVVAFGSALALIFVSWLSGVHLTGQWAQFAFLIPLLVTAVKTYLHVKDPVLPNLPSSLQGSK